MDILNVLQPVWDFFVTYCSTVISIGGYSFTVGALFVWCILASILIGFFRGLAS